ncbi:MAG: hypothetical protein LH702_18330 [Phormidesmis sp. CAN_BIN44]|nr:hypothetical protein [Phormidesmis sp. CAN_BIN44]
MHGNFSIKAIEDMVEPFGLLNAIEGGTIGETFSMFECDRGSVMARSFGRRFTETSLRGRGLLVNLA